MKRSNLYKRNGYWYIRFQHKGRDYRFSTGATSEKAAQRQLHKALANPGEYIKQRNEEKNRETRYVRVWVAKYLDLMQKAGRRDVARRRECLAVLGDQFKCRSLEEITRDDVEAW